MADIAVVGSNNTDLITYITRLPVEGETIEAPDFMMGFGGKGSNQAVAAARLGSKVLMITCVGDDDFGDAYLKNYRDNGIPTDHVKQVPGTSGVAPIFVDQESRNRIIIVKGANNQLLPEDVEAARGAIAECSLIVCQLEIRMETVEAAIRIGEELDVPVLLNPAPAVPDLDMAMVAKCRYFMPNETELALLTGMSTTTDEEVRLAAKKLLDAGCEHVIVTLGNRGLLWMSSDGDDSKIGSVDVHPVDTTGAGDAFIGCFAHYVVAGATVAEALERANFYAALSVTRRGTQVSYATMGDFTRWLDERS